MVGNDIVGIRPDVTFSSCSFAQQVSSLWSPGGGGGRKLLVNREIN